MSEVMSNINGSVFIFAVILIGFVVVQATLFLRHALVFNKKHQLYTSNEIKEAMKTSVVSTIGPSFSVVIVALILIPMMGSAVTFMRCGVIGAADFELMNANIAASTLGVTIGSPEFTEAVFTVALFGMVYASLPQMLYIAAICKPLDKAVYKAGLKKRSFVPILAMTAELGFLAYWSIDASVKSAANTAGIITGLVVAMLVGVISQKSNKPKLREWTMSIAMVLGMAAAAVVNSIFGV